MHNANTIDQAVRTRNATKTGDATGPCARVWIEQHGWTPIKFVLVSLDAFNEVADARGYADIRNALDDATTVEEWALVSFATDPAFPIIIKTSASQ